MHLNNIIHRTLNGTQDSDQHLLTLFSIGVQVKAKNILELGVREGTTTTPLLLAAYLNNGQLTSVDINPTPYICPPEFKNNHKFIQSDAIEFLNNAVTNNEHYDLIFVDDWHTYKHVKQELELLSKIVTASDVILLHDLQCWSCPNYFLPVSTKFNYTEWEGGGPYKAVSELDSSIWEWSTIPVNNGLTILRKKGGITYHDQ